MPIVKGGELSHLIETIEILLHTCSEICILGDSRCC